MNSKKILILFSLLALAFFFNGCAPGSGSSSLADPAGFFLGIWHGWIAPITLIWSFFNPEIRIYEQFNTGWWYDFGFYIAVIGGFGGLSLLRKKSGGKK
jgi:hypothetical protein